MRKNIKPFLAVFFGCLTLFMFMALLVIADSHNAELTGQNSIFSIEAVGNVFASYFGFFRKLYFVAAGPCVRLMNRTFMHLFIKCVTLFSLPHRAALLAIELLNLL